MKVHCPTIAEFVAKPGDQISMSFGRVVHGRVGMITAVELDRKAIVGRVCIGELHLFGSAAPAPLIVNSLLKMSEAKSGSWLV